MENSKEQLDTRAVKSGLTASSLCKAFILSTVVIIYLLEILRTWVKGSQCSLILICKKFQFCNFGDIISRSLDLKQKLCDFDNAAVNERLGNRVLPFIKMIVQQFALSNSLKSVDVIQNDMQIG